MREKGFGEGSLQGPATSVPMMHCDPGDGVGAAGGRVTLLLGEAGRVPLQGFDLHEHSQGRVDIWVS